MADTAQKAPVQQSQFKIEHQRFNFIELISLWEGRINTSHLQARFNIQRQQASRIIGDYKKNYPKNLVYNGGIKAYEPAPCFETQHCSRSFEEYMSLYEDDSNLELGLGLEMLNMPFRNIQPKAVRPLLNGIRRKKRLDVGYASVSSPDYESRIIQPHTLVCDGIRWHVRAYCEKNQDFRDFVISRFSPNCEFEGDATHFSKDDTDWNTLVDVIIEPDSRLNKARQRIIAMDYQMSAVGDRFQRTLVVRKAMLLYFKQRLRIDIYHPMPEAQQIIIAPECEALLGGL